MWYVYILTNPLFVGWVKIGKATDVRKRIKQLNTWVPKDYIAYATLQTSQHDKVEKVMHDIFSDVVGVGKMREFFETSPERAFELLKSVARLLPDANISWPILWVPAMTKAKKEKREKSFKFSDHWIKPGDKVEYIYDGTIQLVVHDDTCILRKGEPMSLSKVAWILTGKWYGLRWPAFFGIRKNGEFIKLSDLKK